MTTINLELPCEISEDQMSAIKGFLCDLSAEWDWKRQSTQKNNREMKELDELVTLLFSDERTDSRNGHWRGVKGVEDHFRQFEGKLSILVMYLGDNDAHIIGSNGGLGDCGQLEKDVSNPENELYDKGWGEYVFECSYDDGQFDEYGRCELTPYWEFNQVAFRAIDGLTQQSAEAGRSGE